MRGATTTKQRSGGGTSEQRRARLRLEISRETARLLWEQGVAATGGDQIAEAVGLPTRTIRRHFRGKESCAEPVIMQGVVTLLGVLRRWPRHSSREDHLDAELTASRTGHAEPPVAPADEQLAMRMIRLADTAPALRTAWLMACDQVGHELCAIIGARLDRPPTDLGIRMYAAALAGVDLSESEDVTALARRCAHAIRTAT
ncbi:TetR/AcrR family transcriptional regulator [Streptomyces atriruber]|uniref:TetR/AcrR family transcriptional regulator n=1 Tax=Streptomyces atriruber TaxID=545121 RepID=UPI000AB330BE|nr:TetR/AcrR family transcriptional regulator [Streptomyces atriruber]